MIQEFEKISEKYNVPKRILERIEERISKTGNASLTALQKDVIADEDFWFSGNSNKNVIVQGATSSGKTLVAELLALQSIFSMNKHVIYLVPLKALVSEKVQQFKEDIYNFDAEMKINIFASSSDYQDHDTELADGQYDIAVVVYEKFFAMLAEQRDNKFLGKCGLIVVDEMQLIGAPERGAKLEYALTKVRNNNNNIKILGLTTVDCNMNYVKRWLDAKVIYNSQRPIGLIEKIISLNGMFWERTIDENENFIDEKVGLEHQEGNLVIEGAEKLRNQKKDIKKNAILIELLKDIFTKDPNKKVIIFANGRSRCKKIARNIAESGLLERKNVSSELMEELNKSDDESEKVLLQEVLLPHGLAYHSAALPMSLRELIEREYRKNDGDIKIIIATETLTIGLNLPADVMILYDNKVRREDGDVDIGTQEYKNYIGRAGRLGITDKKGESYLLVDSDLDIRFYWNNYVNCKIQEVSSALKGKSERECAPYYLNLLCKGKELNFSETTLVRLGEITLNSAEDTVSGNKSKVDYSKIINDLKKVDLIREDGTDIDFELDDEKSEIRYKLTNFGELLSPYALSIRTCFRIKKCFRDVHSSEGDFLPFDYTADDLKNEKYLLDILYKICEMDEVKRLNYPRLPDPTSNHRSRMIYEPIEKTIKEYVDKYKNDKGESAFWPGSQIEKKFFCEDKEVEPEQLNLIFRAISLLHWIKGELPSQMKDSIGFTKQDFTFYTGDMARIGESCSYIVEAVSKCMFATGRFDRTALEHAFYALSIKLKYGLTNFNLIQVANRHIYGLSRGTIINMNEEAERLGFDNINLFIRSNDKNIYKYLTKQQRSDLLHQMTERYDDKNTDNLILKVVEDGIVDFMLKDHFKMIARPVSTNIWMESMLVVLASLGVAPVKCMSTNALRLKWDNLEKKDAIILISEKTVLTDADISEFRSKEELKDCNKIIFVFAKEYEVCSDKSENIFISAEYFCKTLLEFIALSGGCDGKAICKYLFNQEGTIYDKGTTVLQNSINDALRNTYVVNLDEGTPYEQYVQRYKYKDKERIDTEHGNASIHRVESVLLGQDYIVKEITVPRCKEEFEKLNSVAEGYYKELESFETLDIIAKEVIQKFECVFLNEELQRIVVDNAKKRVIQLVDRSNGKKVFIQSLVFNLEGMKRINEARIISSVEGRHIARVFNPDIFFSNYNHKDLKGLDKDGNDLKASIFITMEYYEKGDVQTHRKEFEDNTEKIVELGIQMCDALIACHNRGIIHRDVKPANIFIASDNEYLLGDFGSAINYGSAKTQYVGTIDYMSPEAMLGKHTFKSDIYSLGKSLFYLYTGRFSQDDVLDEESLHRILKKAFHEEPEKRFHSAEQFLDALQEIKEKMKH